MARIVRATTESRQVLGEILPLRTPFTCAIGITNVCNFRCIYCAQSMKPKSIQSRMMPLDIFKKSVDDLTGFPDRLKVLLLSCLGEPLIHPDVAEMVEYAEKKHVANIVRIITNGSLLSHEMSDRLIDAGLDHLKISIQGLNDDVYHRMSGTDVRLEKIVDNIAYFYKHKKKTVVNVKIMADAFENPEDEQKFYRMFDEISDIMNIERIVPCQEYVDFSRIIRDKDVVQSGIRMKKNRLCYMPFYMLAVYPDGTIVPCCHISFETYKRLSMGNVTDTNLVDFWNSRKLNEFRLSLLRDERANMPICDICNQFQLAGNPEDVIDNYADILIPKYQMLLDNDRYESAK